MSELKLELVKIVQEGHTEYINSKFRTPRRYNRTLECKIVLSILIISSIILIALLYIPRKESNVSAKTQHATNDIDYTNSYIYEQLSNNRIEVNCNYIDDIKYFAACVYAEAGNQDEVGQRLVIDVILNRCDSFDLTTTQVINAPNQFEVVNNGSINNVSSDNILSVYELISSEIKCRTDYDVFYFRANKYSDYGTPLYKHQDHYFSGR